jgi:hypothetical protein
MVWCKECGIWRFGGWEGGEGEEKVVSGVCSG